MNEFYNFGITLALADAGLTKTAGIGSVLTGAGKALKGAGKWVGQQIIKHPLRSAAAVGIPGGALAALLAARQKEEEPGGGVLSGVVEKLFGEGGALSGSAGSSGGGGLLETLKEQAANPRVQRALAGGAGGAGLGALLGGPEHRGLGALIGGGIGAAGGAFAPEVIEGAKAVPGKARQLINDLVGTGA